MVTDVMASEDSKVNAYHKMVTGRLPEVSEMPHGKHAFSLYVLLGS